MKKVSKDIVLEEIKALRRDLNLKFDEIYGRFDDVDARLDGHDLRFEKLDRKLDDVIAHALDMKRTQASHTEMIGSLGVDLEGIKIELEYANQ